MSEDKRPICTACMGTGFRRWDGNLSTYNQKLPCHRARLAEAHPDLACFGGRRGPPPKEEPVAEEAP